MNEGMEKFRKLLLTDEDFRNKLKEAVESYNGEKTEEAVFNNVVVPLAAQYDITATYEEFQSYQEHLANADTELNQDEVAQIAGGKDIWGAGSEVCYYVGAGCGGTSHGACFLVGGTDGARIETCIIRGDDMLILPGEE